MEDVTVDVARLREEVQEKYRAVVEHHDRSFHFHTGLRAAVNAGYRDESLDGLPQQAVASVRGRLHFIGDSRGPASGSSTSDRGRDGSPHRRSGRRARGRGSRS